MQNSCIMWLTSSSEAMWADADGTHSQVTNKCYTGATGCLLSVSKRWAMIHFISLLIIINLNIALWHDLKKHCIVESFASYVVFCMNMVNCCLPLHVELVSVHVYCDNTSTCRHGGTCRCLSWLLCLFMCCQCRIEVVRSCFILPYACEVLYKLVFEECL